MPGVAQDFPPAPARLPRSRPKSDDSHNARSGFVHFSGQMHFYSIVREPGEEASLDEGCRGAEFSLLQQTPLAGPLGKR